MLKLTPEYIQYLLINENFTNIDLPFNIKNLESYLSSETIRKGLLNIFQYAMKKSIAQNIAFIKNNVPIIINSFVENINDIVEQITRNIDSQTNNIEINRIIDRINKIDINLFNNALRVFQIFIRLYISGKDQILIKQLQQILDIDLYTSEVNTIIKDNISKILSSNNIEKCTKLEKMTEINTHNPATILNNNLIIYNIIECLLNIDILTNNTQIIYNTMSDFLIYIYNSTNNKEYVYNIINTLGLIFTIINTVNIENINTKKMLNVNLNYDENKWGLWEENTLMNTVESEDNSFEYYVPFLNYSDAIYNQKILK